MPLSPMNELFHKAVEAGNVEKLERMVNSIDRTGETPLHKATQLGNLKMVKYLIKAGAQMEEKNSKGKTSLHLAAVYGKSEIVKHLIEKGAMIEAQTNNGRTPLHLAKTPEVAKYLIDNGAQIEAKAQCSKIGKKVHFQKCKKTLFALSKMAKKSIFAPEKSPKDAFLVV